MRTREWSLVPDPWSQDHRTTPDQHKHPSGPETSRTTQDHYRKDFPMTRHWTRDNWVTTNFIPTPGWTNTFTADDGGSFESPCPGVLVQELRSVTRYRQDPGNDGEPVVMSSVSECEAPYDTRVVAADIEFGCLEPVVDVRNYDETTTAEEAQ